MECIYRRHLFSILKVVGVVFGILYCLKVGPAWFFAPDVGPFCMRSSHISKFARSNWLGVLALLVGYGLLEFIGTFCRPIMRPLWNTPGRRQSTQLRPSLEVIRLLSLLRIACIKKESIRQKAAIIATGFSTVSATFMIIIAKH